MKKKELIHKMKLFISKLLCCGDCNVGNNYKNCKVVAAEKIAKAVVKEFGEKVPGKSDAPRLNGEVINHRFEISLRADLEEGEKKKQKESFGYEILEAKQNYLKIRKWHIVYGINDVPIAQKDHAKIFEVFLDMPIEDRVQYLENKND